jgi:hypothetical protein
MEMKMATSRWTSATRDTRLNNFIKHERIPPANLRHAFYGTGGNQNYLKVIGSDLYLRGRATA